MRCSCEVPSLSPQPEESASAQVQWAGFDAGECSRGGGDCCPQPHHRLETLPSKEITSYGKAVSVGMGVQ